METSSSMSVETTRSVQVDEWQKNYCVVTSSICTPKQKADAYRALLLHIQYAYANSEISQVFATNLFKRYTEKYSAIIDSDNVVTGLNNYAESIFALAGSRQADSNKWQSGLSIDNVFKMSCVQEMMQAGKKFEESLLEPADASVVLCKEPTAFEVPQLSVCGGSEDADILSSSGHDTDKTQAIPGSSLRCSPFQSARLPKETNTTKTCLTSSTSLGESATAAFHMTPLFGNTEKDTQSFPKTSTGLNMFLSNLSCVPSGCENPQERKAFNDSDIIDILSNSLY